MTFTEAAAHVLRLVGKPLHYKEITDLAIERGLLSHVGKSPEVTMGARLAAQVKKVGKENPLSRVKPGVFALSDWDEKMVEQGLADRTPALQRLLAAEAERGKFPEAASEAAHAEPSSSPHAAHLEISAADTPPDEDEQRRAQLSAAATDLFEEEDDDDQPIFGGPEPEVETTDREGDRAEGKRRRRRRRGRGRGSEEGVDDANDDLPTYTVSDADPGEFVDLEEAAGLGDRSDREPRGGREPREARESREPRESRDREPREPREARGGREPREGRDSYSRDRSSRDSRDSRDSYARDSRDSGSRDSSSRDGVRDNSPRDSFEMDAPGADGSLAGMLEAALSKYDRSKGPVPAQNVADALRRKLGADVTLSAGSVVAIAQADNLAAERQCRPPRFRIAGSKLALASWAADKRLVERHRALALAAEQVLDSTTRALAEELKRLPQRAFGELVTVLLSRMGLSDLTFVRRPGAHGSELHLSGVFLSGGLDPRSGGALRIPTAVMIRRDGKDIGRERVTELRGALHHYGPAAQGWLISGGQVLSGAREEAQSVGASPVVLSGRNELAELCIAHGVGVRMHRIELPTIDTDLFENLSGR